MGSFDHAALKKFPYQLTAGHCEPSPGYSNTIYIWGGRGGGSGALGIISSVQPTKTVNKRHIWQAHMAGPFKEGLLSYAFLAIGFGLLLGPGVSPKARAGLCWVAIPGLMVAVPPGTGVVAFLWILVGIIVYRCKRWCADVVARIEAIESTMQVTQNPPPPRRGLLNMYSGEIGICVLLFYLVFLYQHSL